jgi:hypothetical protein
MSYFSGGHADLVVFVFVILVLGFFVYYYLTSSCVPVSVFSIYRGKIHDVMELIKDASPGDYEMICGHIGLIQVGVHRGSFLFPSAEAGKHVVSFSLTMLDYGTDRMIAGILVHESCHAMMYDLRGDLNHLTDKEIERPCERMRYRFLYEVGYFKSFDQMVRGLSGEDYGEDFTGEQAFTASSAQSLRAYFRKRFEGSDVSDYCRQTALKVEEIPAVDGFDLLFTNVGKTIIHSGFIELQVNGREYPLESAELKSGDSLRTGDDFRLKRGDGYRAKVVGC